MNAPQRLKGFSLPEVVIAIGLASVALAAILGCFSAGLQTAAACQHQTRAYQLAKSLFAELHSGPFPAVSCSGQTFDLSRSGTERLYATFQDEMRIGTAAPENGVEGYAIELQYDPVILEDGSVAGGRVVLAISALGRPERVYRYVSLVGNY